MSSTAGEGLSTPGTYIEPDPMQAIWNDHVRLGQSLYVGDHFMVRPDDRPVAPHHLLVVAREPVPIEELSFAKQQAMWALVMVVRQHMTEVLQPSRKVGVVMWGNQVRTGHVHLVARNAPQDATIWKPQQLTPEELAAQLADTRRLLALPPDVKARADFAVEETLRRTGTVHFEPVPHLPNSGEQQ